MPTAEIVDLDAIFSGVKKVRLDKKVWTLPKQIPVPLYLLVKQRQKERAEAIERGDQPDDVDVIEEIHRQVLELFQIHHPDLEVLPVGMDDLFDVIPIIYGAEGGAKDDEPEETLPPTKTRARTGSGNSTRRQKPNKSR